MWLVTDPRKTRRKKSSNKSSKPDNEQVSFLISTHHWLGSAPAKVKGTVENLTLTNNLIYNSHEVQIQFESYSTYIPCI